MSAPVQTVAPAPPAPAHAPWLDWLRALAALTVLVSHARGGHWLAWADLDPASRNPLSLVFFAWSRLSHESVIFFLVLSGYLIGGSCWEKARAGSFRPAAYATDRATRIYLGYLPALALSVFVDRHFLVSGQDALASLVGHAAFLQIVFVPPLHSNPALWTLAYLAWFSVFAGGFAACLGPQPRARRLGLLVVLGALALLCFAHLPYFACWLFGAAVRVLAPEARPLARWTGGLALALAGSLTLQFGSNNSLLPALGRPAALLHDTGEILLGLATAWLLPELSRMSLHPALTRVGAWLAGFSFSLYLVHMPILAAWNTFTPFRRAAIDAASCASFAAKLLLCYVVAWLFHRLFEAPLPALRAWLRHRLFKAPPPSVPPPACAAS